MAETFRIMTTASSIQVFWRQLHFFETLRIIHICGNDFFHLRSVASPSIQMSANCSPLQLDSSWFVAGFFKVCCLDYSRFVISVLDNDSSYNVWLVPLVVIHWTPLNDFFHDFRPSIFCYDTMLWKLETLNRVRVTSPNTWA
jgi:hypothetical protein